MVRHIVSWTFDSRFSDVEKRAHAAKIKDALEALKQVIPGIVELRVITQPMASSTCDMALISLFESEEALAAYRVHPDHQQVSAFVGTVMQERRCLDCQE